LDATVTKSPSRAVWIYTKPFFVIRNLYDALNHWQGWKHDIGTAKALLWVDAICISQDDLIERNHQVGLMGQIYSKATLVIAWVGTSDEDSFTAIKLISRLKPVVELW
jgi:Heterokaryon incompatibility protein (HET)